MRTLSNTSASVLPADDVNRTGQTLYHCRIHAWSELCQITMTSTNASARTDVETATSLEAAADDWAFDAVDSAALDSLEIVANPTNY